MPITWHLFSVRQDGPQRHRKRHLAVTLHVVASTRDDRFENKFCGLVNTAGKENVKRKTEAGQAIVTAAVTLTALLLAAGLAIDMGFLRYQKRHMQTAADGAALAAAGNLDGDYATAAQNDAQLNGFTADTPSTTCPPSTPSGATPITMCAQVIAPGATGNGTAVCPSSDDPCVNVMISQNTPTFFMKVAGVNSELVTASAVARQSVTGCIYSLGPDDYMGSIGAYSVTVEGNINANYCAVLSGGSLGINGIDESHTITATALGSSTGGCPPGTSCDPVKMIPSPIQKIPTPPDLLSYLQSEIPTAPNAPAPGSCGYSYCAGSYPSGMPTLAPGAGTTITLQPGVYVLGGTTGLTISAPGSIPSNGVVGSVIGDGVMFYTSGSSPISINQLNVAYSNCGGTNNIGATVRLSAPTSGPYAGILFFQDAGDTHPLSITLNNGDDCNGNFGTTTNESYAWGAVYAPGAAMYVSGIGLNATNGCSYLPKYTLLIGQNVILGGDVNINGIDCPYAGTTPAYFAPYTGSDLPPSPIQKGAVIVQ